MIIMRNRYYVGAGNPTLGRGGTKYICIRGWFGSQSQGSRLGKPERVENYVVKHYVIVMVWQAMAEYEYSSGCKWVECESIKNCSVGLSTHIAQGI